MAFSESPKIVGGKIVSRPSLGSWIKSHHNWLLVAIVILIIADAFAVNYASSPGAFQKPPGGLDGCLVTSSGDPVSGSVSMDEILRPIYTDGCFFFATLSPGVHQLNILTPNGVALTQKVTIISGEAVGLGTVSLP